MPSLTDSHIRGANAIWVHQMQPDGTLELVKEVKSARDEDGPRHAVVSANGKCLYAVSSLSMPLSRPEFD